MTGGRVVLPNLDHDPRGSRAEVERHVICGRAIYEGDAVRLCDFAGEVDVVIVARGLGEWACPECNGLHDHVEEPPDCEVDPWED